MKVRVKFAPEYGIGESDGVDTYCCTATPAHYVVFPGEKPWEGHYFNTADLEEV